jgi:hypothetical protein
MLCYTASVEKALFTFYLTEGPVKLTSKIRIVATYVTADLQTISCEYVIFIFIFHFRKKLHTPSLNAFSGYH